MAHSLPCRRNTHTQKLKKKKNPFKERKTLKPRSQWGFSEVGPSLQVTMEGHCLHPSTRRIADSFVAFHLPFGNLSPGYSYRIQFRASVNKGVGTDEQEGLGALASGHMSVCCSPPPKGPGNPWASGEFSWTSLAGMSLFYPESL